MRAILVLLAGCALTSKAQPLEVQYYSPASATAAERSRQGVEAARVRLGRVSSSSSLRHAIARRESAVELRFYDTRRWTDPPDVYLKRSLEHALFAARPIEQVTSGPAITLEVEVTAFEEVRSPISGGRVQLRYRLRDERRVIDSDVVTVVRGARSTEFAAIVTAIGDALDAATAEVADRVMRQVLARG